MSCNCCLSDTEYTTITNITNKFEMHNSKNKIAIKTREKAKKILPSPELSPIIKSCPSFASWSNAWQTGFELLKCIDFIGSYMQNKTSHTLYKTLKPYLNSNMSTYLVLGIQITYKDCITHVKYQISSFAIKIWCRTHTSWTRSPQRPNFTCIHTLAPTIASNKAKCPAPIAANQKPGRRRTHARASAKARWCGSWGRRRRLFFEMC